MRIPQDLKGTKPLYDDMWQPKLPYWMAQRCIGLDRRQDGDRDPMVVLSDDLTELPHECANRMCHPSPRFEASQELVMTQLEVKDGQLVGLNSQEILARS